MFCITDHSPKDSEKGRVGLFVLVQKILKANRSIPVLIMKSENLHLARV